MASFDGISCKLYSKLSPESIVVEDVDFELSELAPVDFEIDAADVVVVENHQDYLVDPY